ncbi:glycosyltransferase family 2 protein [Flavobacteriaceae bacterium LMO-SS05]
MTDQKTTEISHGKLDIHSPFFSIIIATYNRAHLLKRAIDSLLLQTEEDWEAIIVDDGSSDATDTQILSYLKRYPNIRYLKKEHSGEALSKNEGIRMSNGKFISFLDSDDEYAPNHLQSRKRMLLENPSIKFVHGGFRVIGNQYVPDRFDNSKKTHLKDCVVGGTFFIERKIFSLLNGYSKIHLGTDADLFDRAKAAQIEIMETDIPSYIYHHETQDSITNTMCMSL